MVKYLLSILVIFANIGCGNMRSRYNSLTEREMSKGLLVYSERNLESFLLGLTQRRTPYSDYFSNPDFKNYLLNDDSGMRKDSVYKRILKDSLSKFLKLKKIKKQYKIEQPFVKYLYDGEIHPFRKYFYKNKCERYVDYTYHLKPYKQCEYRLNINEFKTLNDKELFLLGSIISQGQYLKDRNFLITSFRYEDMFFPHKVVKELNFKILYNSVNKKPGMKSIIIKTPYSFQAKYEEIMKRYGLDLGFM